jgi:limonene 1,2-monooxygenase
MISPSGMTLAGKYGMGILSIGSVTTAGVAALPLQWSFAEEAAEQAGTTVDRRDWRIVLNFHIAETREAAKEQAKHGLMRWHNEYTVGTLQRVGVEAFDTPDQAVEQTAYVEGSAAVIGTPDDLVQRIREIKEITGGFGTVIGFVHDWTTPEHNARSWDLVARHVIPEVNGLLDDYRESQKFVIEHREYFERAGQAIMSKIMENDRAKAALEEQANGAPAIQPHSSHVPTAEPAPTGGD